MKLTELNPKWLSHGGEGITYHGQPVPLREKIGITFDCPCLKCGQSIHVSFTNPIDNLPSIWAGKDHPTWVRDGDDFISLTLSPSIQRIGGCGWHGYVTLGEIITV